MSSVNKVFLIGHLGRDPEIRRSQSGDPVATFRMATSATWRDKATGERKEKTEWHSVVIFNENLVKIAEQYLQKGSQVCVEGQLQTRKWQDQAGADRYSTEVVLKRFKGELTLLDKRERHTPSQDDYGSTTTKQSNYNGGDSAVQTTGQRFNDLDDDIPF